MMHGPPARTRISRRRVAADDDLLRSTRAHAEKPTPCRRRGPAAPVHPRARGKAVKTLLFGPTVAGPAARTRKSRDLGRHPGAALRSTRAHAEKPRRAFRIVFTRSVHPRARGKAASTQAPVISWFSVSTKRHRASQGFPPRAGMSRTIPWPNALCRPTPSISVRWNRSASVTVSTPAIQACGTVLRPIPVFAAFRAIR